MGTKTVIGADQREWQVKRNIEWSTPATGDEFEHDVDGGRGAALMILSSLFLMWVVVFAWKPAGVNVPWFYILVFILILGFFPVRWYLRRPWTINAKTQGSYEDGLPAENWTGMVRGIGKAREEMRVVVRSLKTRATPGHADSPLQPVN
ncbi:MAG TPA: hypothetical protein VGO23_02960 [Pseudonocardia sp.]|jgi:hypothetical protein|nr:hypothetical protein [Pseudonocardia sp.]